MDVKIVFKDGAGDITLSGYDLGSDESLVTAVVISLFTDRRSEDDDVIPDGTSNRRGWWGDTFADIDGDRIGSRLWLLHREKQTQAVMNRAIDYAREALQWMIDDGLAKAVRVSAFIPRFEILGLRVEIDRPDGDTVEYHFSHLWEAL